jgi:hypothetical protein
MRAAAHATSEDRCTILRGPQIAGRRILRNDQGHMLIVDDRLFLLTPLVYSVCLLLLQQRERWERNQAPGWISAAALGAETGITDADLLRRHVNRANLELRATGIYFVRNTTEDGDIYQTLLGERDIRREKVR